MLKVQTDFSSSVCCLITGLHSNVLVCKLQFYTVHFTVLQPQLPNDLVKTTYFL